MTTPVTPPKAALTKIDMYRPRSVGGLRQLAAHPLVAVGLLNALPSSLRKEKDRFVQAMLTEVGANPRLMDCSPVSLFTCVVRAAQLGLIIGGPAGQAFIVPYHSQRKRVTEAQLQLGYRGLILMAQRTNLIRRITPITVRGDDLFLVERGTEQKIVHRPTGDENRPAVAYYVVVERTNGGIDFEWFSQRDAVAFRDRYAASRNRKEGPWYDMVIGGGFERMAEKTLLRRLCKRLPLAEQWVEAIELDEQSVIGKDQDHSEVEKIILASVEEADPPRPPADEQTIGDDYPPDDQNDRPQIDDTNGFSDGVWPEEK